MTDLVPSQNGGYDLTSIGLKLKDPNLPLEDFANLCWMLGRFHEAVRFAIGDAIIQGEYLFGEEAHQAIEEMQLSEDARKEYVRVAERVPRYIRRKDLSWSHHRAVAALTTTTEDGERVPDREAQKKWLKRASEERMSHHQLRESLRDGVTSIPRGRDAFCEACGRPL